MTIFNKVFAYKFLTLDLTRTFDASMKGNLKTILEVSWNNAMPFFAGFFFATTLSLWWIAVFMFFAYLKLEIKIE